MAATSNNITLTFTSNTASLDKGFKDVQAGAARTETAMRGTATQAQELGESLELTGRQAKGSAELIRGVGGASMLMGGQAGAATTNMLLMATVTKDLTKGMGVLAKTLTLGKVAMGGIVAAIATAGVAVSAHIDHTSMLNEVERTGADTAFYAADALSTLTAKVPVLGGWFDKLRDKTDGLSQALHGMGQAALDAGNAAAQAQLALNGLGQGGFSNDPDGMAFSASMLDGSNAQSAQFMSSLADDAATAAARARKSSGGGGGGGASAVKSSFDAAKAAAKQKLSEWQSVVDQARQVGQSIAKALAPKLDPTFNSQNALLSQRKGGVIAGLQDQLRKMKELSRDVDKLAKMGLAPDLLQQIVAAGPDGLDSARELLQGNNVATANSLDKSINKYANHIAVGESTREFNNQPKEIKVKVDVTGGESDLKKLVRKWIRTDGGGNVQLALGGK